MEGVFHVIEASFVSSSMVLIKLN
ncbi:BH0385 [Halalkalibacterium halodurans C-125]|uniref:BH0385 protein n=1 Tax=Halalkalibacterium halodurans (strain ATCC BAA-125 / DSM 18197 / FERM 7344 / JCM 9153 / C-125) TaxID=272558 RepID=Q9KFU1_HALH5|nr:BH0385 [Halalkalibacterium halodurans C-125]